MVIDPSVEALPNPLQGNYWCGAGVAYKLCESMLPKEKAKELEVYAGLATVADCMNLKEGNWGLVRRAIKAFRNKTAPKPLLELAKAMGQNPEVCTEDLFGFYLGPAFNAPGRLYDKGPNEVLKYLHNPTEERRQNLIETNNRRKELRDEEMLLVEDYIERNDLSRCCPIWVMIDNLHEGIVGILAGRITEKYKVPAIVVTNLPHEPGVYKGSARGYGDFNIFQYLSDMPSDTFLRMGGHKGAAGLSITKEKFLEACKIQAPSVTSVGGVKKPMPIKKWEIPSVTRVVDKFRPFGEGNDAPLFEVEVFPNDKQKFIGDKENHLLIQDEKLRWKILHFNHTDIPLANKIHFGLIGKVSESYFAGRKTPNFNADEAFDFTEEKEKVK